jgi:hypothetical protein
MKMDIDFEEDLRVAAEIALTGWASISLCSPIITAVLA